MQKNSDYQYQSGKVVLYLYRQTHKYNKMVTDKKWRVLPNPPIVLALFQVKFKQEALDTVMVKRIEKRIMEKFPICATHHQSNFSISSPLQVGQQTLKANTSTKVVGYTYSTKDQKVKINIEQGTVTYHDERKYEGWENFILCIREFLDLMSPLISESLIHRVSIRFINKFVLPDFNNPLEYTNVIVSSSQNADLAYPVSKYAFRLFHDIPDTHIKSWVNHSLDNIDGKLNYMFDIDVLDHQNIVYNEETIIDILENLRIVKNNIFFETLTDKTLDLCY